MSAVTTVSLQELFYQHFNQASALLEKKEYHKANLFFARSLTIGEILNDPQLIIKSFLKIADVLFVSNKLQDAYTVYQDLEALETDMSPEVYCHVRNRIGVIFARTGRYQEAKNIFEDMVKHDDPKAKRRAYINMGMMYYYRHSFFEENCMDKAIQSFTKADEFCSGKDDDQLMKHRILRDIGMAFYEMKDYTSALRKFKESLLLIEDKVELAKTLNEIAKVYIEFHDYEQAQKNLREAEKILLHKNYRNLEELSRNIFIHGLLSKKQGRTETAFSQFKTALQGFVESEIYPEAVLVCREIYEMYRDINTERADFYMDQYQFYLNYLDPMVL